MFGGPEEDVLVGDRLPGLRVLRGEALGDEMGEPQLGLEGRGNVVAVEVAALDVVEPLLLEEAADDGLQGLGHEPPAPEVPGDGEGQAHPPLPRQGLQRRKVRRDGADGQIADHPARLLEHQNVAPLLVVLEPVEGLTDVEAVAHEAVDLLVPAPDGVIRKILLPELPKDEAGSL